MDLFDLSSALFGRKGMDSDFVEYEETTRTYVGTATSDSADGSVYVELSEDVTMPDEYEGEHGMGVEMPTVPGVSEGDEVLVTVFGSGAMKSPVVTGNAGEGDRQNAAIAAAHAVADAAQAVADAINQHFWHDTNGVYVTEATQEDWNDNHSGANVLINSIGQLFRDGLNNLLTLTTENGARALTIWDGLGNAASNIVSSFTGEGADFYSNGSIGMRVGRVSFNGMTKFGLAGYDSDGEVAGLLSVLMSGYMRLHSRYSSSISSSSDRYIGEVEAANTFVRAMLHLPGDAENDPSFLRSITSAGYTERSHAGSNTWSTPAGTVLWSGAYYMMSNHTANLKYNVSTCPTGIVLHFQPYTNSTIRNWNHIYYFVPKEHVASYNGSGIVVRLGNPDFSNLASKYLYISNDHITGNDQNNTSGTNSGISYNNAAWVMTQVIAV